MNLVRRVDYRRVVRHQGAVGACCTIVTVFTAPFATPPVVWACIGAVIGWGAAVPCPHCWG